MAGPLSITNNLFLYSSSESEFAIMTSNSIDFTNIFVVGLEIFSNSELIEANCSGENKKPHMSACFAANCIIFFCLAATGMGMGMFGFFSLAPLILKYFPLK